MKPTERTKIYSLRVFSTHTTNNNSNNSNNNNASSQQEIEKTLEKKWIIFSRFGTSIFDNIILGTFEIN